MRRKSEKTKKKQKYGTGTQADYISYIETREFNPIGTTCNVRDWKTGRTVELLSQVEMKVWYLLRWDDRVIDIREQFPLNKDTTLEIANKFNLKHPMYDGQFVRMTTDFIVTLANGKQVAIYVKYGKNDWKKNRRTIEKAYIEKYYWEEKQNTSFIIVTNDDINQIFYQNIELVVPYYDRKYVHDPYSMIKHLVATKQIKVDMKSQLLDFKKLHEKHGGKLW